MDCLESYVGTRPNVRDRKARKSGYSDEVCEWRLRQRYPLLCQRFLDGYTETQVARGQHISMTELRNRIGAERIRLYADELSSYGPGLQLKTMIASSRKLRSVCANRPV